jgi:hypothetical protein
MFTETKVSEPHSDKLFLIVRTKLPEGSSQQEQWELGDEPLHYGFIFLNRKRGRAY